MKILEALIHTPLARTLGWSLAHFLWEGAAIAAALAAALWLCGPRPARLRYALCCLAMLAMPLVFGITAALRPAPASTPAAIAIPARPPDGPDALQVSVGSTRPWTERLREGLPWAVPIWMAGVLVFCIRSVGSCWAVGRLRRSGVCAASREWLDRVDRLRERLHLEHHVALLESCLVDVPVVIGVLRPAILMPVGFLTGLSTGQVESILIHELAHVRRLDYLVNLLQNFVECLLFYHPAVWWVSGMVRGERENCCDDVVVQLSGDARGYAAALATLETNRWAAGEPALAATGGKLMKRIHRLLQHPERPRTAGPVLAAGLLLVSMAIAVSGWPVVPQKSQTVAAQQPAPRTLIAQAPPEPQRKNAQAKRSGLESPYRKWMTEDVAYIITDEERAAFKNLQTDEEREHFIEQFWLRRDPTPATPENEMKEEHYRRIAYANEHYADDKVPGWKTDRGRIYISYGPADEIESHPSGGDYRQGSATIKTFPFEQWRYRHIAGVGNDVIIEFVDPDRTGEYRMTMDPSEKDATRVAGIWPVRPAGATARTASNGGAVLSVPLTSYGDHDVNVVFQVVTAAGRDVTKFEDTVRGTLPAYTRFIALPPGMYRLIVTIKDPTGGPIAGNNVSFEVK